MREIICNAYFPRVFLGAKRGALQNLTILSIGANLGNPIASFMRLLRSWRRNPTLKILSTSPIYKNPPFGFRNQRDFYNITLLLGTSMCLRDFYRFIFYTERVFGRERKRAFRNAPRTLDIDIIFFNDIFTRLPWLNIPHLLWSERESVLIPLFYQFHHKALQCKI